MDNGLYLQISDLHLESCRLALKAAQGEPVTDAQLLGCVVNSVAFLVAYKSNTDEYEDGKIDTILTGLALGLEEAGFHFEVSNVVPLINRRESGD